LYIKERSAHFSFKNAGYLKQGTVETKHLFLGALTCFGLENKTGAVTEKMTLLPKQKRLVNIASASKPELLLWLRVPGEK